MNKEKFRDKYYRGIEEPPTPAMLYGSKFGKMVEKNEDTDDPRINALRPFCPRYEVMEFKLEAVLEAKEGKIPLLGYLDTSHADPTKGYREYKTGVKPWTQKRVDEHGQITFYHLMAFLKYGGIPEKTHLDWFETMIEGDKTVMTGRHFHFATTRTMSQILGMAARIKQTALEISEDYSSYLKSLF